MSETTLPGREECPGQLIWSAFGARYPDSVCSSALDWTGCDYEPVATLCDADDDFRPKDVPCPFCNPVGFIDYEWGDDVLGITEDGISAESVGKDGGGLMTFTIVARCTREDVETFARLLWTAPGASLQRGIDATGTQDASRHTSESSTRSDGSFCEDRFNSEREV